MRGSRSLILIVVIPLVMALAGCEEGPPVPEDAHLAPRTRPATGPAGPGLVSVPPVSARPGPEPPHGGCLLPMSDGRGYVEWVVETGRLYYLDPAGSPLAGVSGAALHVRSATGPRAVPLVDCGDADYPDACVTVAPGSDLLRRPDTGGVLRFSVHGEGCRVLLRFKPPASPAAGATLTPADTQPGS